jgi:AcrR family transcriptional regulator
VGRKAHPERRRELLAGTASYLEQRGLAGLSLRPLATALGVSPRTLLYHFGSKEQLLTEALNASPALNDAVGEFVASDAALFDRLRRIWARTAEPSSRQFLRLFFEVYAAALREQHRYASFLNGVVADWLSLLTPMLEREGLAPVEAATMATELLALHHGCALDLLATGDRTRVTAAYLAHVAELEARLRGEASARSAPSAPCSPPCHVVDRA